ncbi:hypothetical protein GCM10011514_05460 [Emticicia aquatilis]|uniref:Gliding motility-associated C-terminal domain-containing protein n=1 Tax=Emticicia aquatilis TaxID=1537369 RepID=A0A916YHJ5_9BACT|nr:hypothetical protein [Emticicia aquatilis]GGD44402.1 hypothetical protein GCM10011514_05460 [Emticicia aquatilis]
MKKTIITFLFLVSLQGFSQTFINPNGAVNVYEKESLYFNRKDNFLQLKNAGITFLNERTSNAQFVETSALTSNYTTTTNTNIIQNYTPTIDGQIVYVDVYGIDQNPTLGTRVITNCILEIIDKTNNTIIATSDESLLNTGYPCLPNRLCPPKDYVRFSLSPFPLRLQAGKQYALQLRNTSPQFQAAISCENIYPFGSTNITCQNQTENADLNFKTTFLGVLELARIDQEGNATFNVINSTTLQVKGVEVKGTKSGFVVIGQSNTKCKDVTIIVGEQFTSLNCLVANEPSTDYPDCFSVSLRKYLTDSNTGYQTGAVMRVCRIDDNSWGQNPRILYNYQPFYP